MRRRTNIILVLILALAAFVSSLAAEGAEQDPGWLELVQERIADSEYAISWHDVWQASNRAQNLGTYFEPDGIRVVRRTDIEPSWV